MAGSKSFLLAVHAHQPVGNFGWVFDEAYKNSYFPFFETLEAHPKIKLAAHFSGSLIDWIAAERPEFIRVVRNMVRRGQLEVMGGAYYEPIYGMIPARDLDAQIRRMSAKVSELFGAAPEGAWLSERVWDPEIAPVMRSAGIRYTVLDDYHLTQAGEKAPVTGLYEAEGSGAAIEVFASTQKLRYLMPFRAPEETLKFVKGQKTAGPADAVVFADDIEKFGLWPGTHELVYKKRWLDRFFTGLERERGIELFTFSEFRRQFRPKKKCAVPHASYAEMMQWSGGRFSNFLDKYSESRYARDRMTAVSAAVESARAAGLSGERLERARTALYKSQCNCAYWHGVFGGLYLHHLRSAIFENLIEAEETAALAPPPAVEKLALESGARFRLRGGALAAIFDPAKGGCLEELDFLPARVNLGCTLRRRKECYHEAVFNPVPNAVPNEIMMIYRMLGAKRHGLEKELRFDRFERRSFIDHFYEAPVTAAAFMDQSAADVGDFAAGPYEPAAGADSVSFERLGCLEIKGRQLSLSVKKSFRMNADGAVAARYTLTNAGRDTAEFTLGVEFNFSIGAGAGFASRTTAETALEDSWHGLTLVVKADQAVDMLAAPLETISESEQGLDKTCQGQALLIQKRFRIEAGQSRELELSVGARAGIKRS